MFGRPCPAAGIPSAFSAADDEAVLDRERRQVRHAAGSRMAVLLNGKGGTDKATTAHRRHGLSPQSESAFLQVNCCAFSQRLIECELYGHGQAGPAVRKRGRVETGRGGTLFLDKVGELSKILRSAPTRPTGSSCLRSNWLPAGVPVGHPGADGLPHWLAPRGSWSARSEPEPEPGPQGRPSRHSSTPPRRVASACLCQWRTLSFWSLTRSWPGGSFSLRSTCAPAAAALGSQWFTATGTPTPVAAGSPVRPACPPLTLMRSLADLVQAGNLTVAQASLDNMPSLSRDRLHKYWESYSELRGRLRSEPGLRVLVAPEGGQPIAFGIAVQHTASRARTDVVGVGRFSRRLAGLSLPWEDMGEGFTAGVAHVVVRELVARPTGRITVGATGE